MNESARLSLHTKKNKVWHDDEETGRPLVLVAPLQYSTVHIVEAKDGSVER